MSTALEPQPADRCVRVWFGQHKIVEHIAEPTHAARFEASMRRRFASLRVTNEPVAKPVVTDYSRPLLLGYVLRSLLLTDDELTATKQRLERSAAEEGFEIGTIYVEVAASSSAAFEALIDAVNRYEVTAVVVPSLLHFAALSAVKNIKDTFERATGARVIVASSAA